MRAITSSASERQQQTGLASDNIDLGEAPKHDDVPASGEVSFRRIAGFRTEAEVTAGNSSNTTHLPKAESSTRVPPPISASVNGTHLVSMLKTMREARKLGLPDASQSYKAEPEGFKVTEREPTRRPGARGRSADLRISFNRLKKLSVFRDRMAERTRLPMMEKDTYKRLIQLIGEAEILIVAGSTGCGKTTQVPQIILDYAIQRGSGAYCNVICTQPRRISATSIAKRVAHERCEPLGHSVGYHVRFDRHRPDQEGSILYCTTGVLLKQMQEDPDYYMSRTSHIIVDEVHERSLATDHLLTLIRELINRRKAKGQPFPKLILMSATIDTKAFVDYFEQPIDIGDGSGAAVRRLKTRFMEVPGRMFPVECKFLGDFLPQLQASPDPIISALLQSTGENPESNTKPYIQLELKFATTSQTSSAKLADNASDDEDGEEDASDSVDTGDAVDPGDIAEDLSPTGLAAATIAHVANNSSSGDILAFLPGLGEIERTWELLVNRKPLGLEFEGGQIQLFMLHSTLGEINDNVFNPVPAGVRRIVLATNIAESSITLPDVEHVIDMGKVRYYTHDHLSGDREYAARWISKASSKQRLGRAGRVRPGAYYALFTRERHESFADHAPPEMTRINIVGTCLEVVAQKISSDVSTFMNRCPTPPKPESVTAALQTLERLGAITENQELTALGRVLSIVPLPPAEGKAVLLGTLFKCLEPMLIMACYESDSPLISNPIERRTVARMRRLYSGKSESDIMAVVNAFKAYDAAGMRGDRETIQRLASEHYIRHNVYKEIRMLAKQIYEHLADAELVPHTKDREDRLFPEIPSYLNTNAGNIPLLKALLMTTLTPNLAVAQKGTGKKWFTRGEGRALLEPKTVNCISGSLALQELGRIRQAGDLMSYSSRREMAEDKYPWIVGGNMVTPLIAVLFASAAEKNGDKIKLDGMVDVGFDVKDNVLNLDEGATTSALLEFRKAIDRFLLTAFEGLRYTNFKGRSGESYGLTPETQAQPESQEQAQDQGATADFSALELSRLFPNSRSRNQRTDFTNTIMRNGELRDAFVGGLAKVLKDEDDALMTLFQQQKVEAQRLKKQEEDKKREEQLAKQKSGNAIHNPPTKSKGERGKGSKELDKKKASMAQQGSEHASFDVGKMSFGAEEVGSQGPLENVAASSA